LLGPQHFIEIAEKSGLIRAIGTHVLRQACADAQTWAKNGHPLRVAINAAAAQLNDLDYIAEIKSALEEFDLDPEQLTVEITETAAMQLNNSLEPLHQIRELGLHLALDDFGTGYSSLSFLRELPIDAIKVDRSFVSGLGVNPRDMSIVQGVLAMAAALDHATVGEGIEKLTQADILRDLGCHYAQGFLWSPAVPAGEIGHVSRRIEGSLGRGTASIR
jgi:EAL domain-containing protein (putative c-di-GMP-specific phosphodiesterase class I)